MSEAYRKEERRKEKEIIGDDEGRRECPQCGTENELEARFCEECGYDFLSTKCCPKCGSRVPENADICEACGEWLLEGQCKFCYAPLEEGAKFCAECGNPVDGVECPRCHRISYFDFCKYCNIPLTEQAIKTIENLKDSKELKELVEIIEHEQEPLGASPEEAELERTREYARKFTQSETKRKAFVLFSKGAASELGERVQQSQQERQAREQKGKSVAPETLEKIQQKSFKNNQEARKFYGALKVLLPTIVRRKVTSPIGWLCNVYGVLHPDGPQGCCAAYGGGTWIHEEREIEEKGIQEVEI